MLENRQVFATEFPSPATAYCLIPYPRIPFGQAMAESPASSAVTRLSGPLDRKIMWLHPPRRGTTIHSGCTAAFSAPFRPRDRANGIEFPILKFQCPYLVTALFVPDFCIYRWRVSLMLRRLSNSSNVFSCNGDELTGSPTPNRALPSLNSRGKSAVIIE